MSDATNRSRLNSNEIVEANSGQATGVNGVVNSLLKADVGIKDRGVIGGLAFRRNRS